jgi:hypothetical protein
LPFKTCDSKSSRPQNVQDSHLDRIPACRRCESRRCMWDHRFQKLATAELKGFARPVTLFTVES